MTTRSGHDCLRIGDWSAERSTGRIARQRTCLMVEPKVMDLLFLLASQPKRVFSREELFELLWPGVTVGDDCLARAVSKLRSALDDDARAPRYVETVPKRGYRLLASVRADPGAEPSAVAGKIPPEFPFRLVTTAAALLLLFAVTVALLAPRDKAPVGTGSAMSPAEISQRAKSHADMADADRRRAEAGKAEPEKH